jgi:outer membrane lipoprotein-sorting protein
MRIKLLAITLAGVLVGCTVQRPGIEHAKAYDPSVEEAKAAYAEIVQKISEAQAVSFSYRFSRESDRTTPDVSGSFVFQMPDKYQNESSQELAIRDRNQLTIISKSRKTYAQTSSINYSPNELSMFGGFENIMMPDAEYPVIAVKASSLNGKPALLVSQDRKDFKTDVYYSQETKLPIRCVVKSLDTASGMNYSITIDYRDVVLDPQLPQDAFQFDLKGYKPMKPISKKQPNRDTTRPRP